MSRCDRIIEKVACQFRSCRSRCTGEKVHHHGKWVHRHGCEVHGEQRGKAPLLTHKIILHLVPAVNNLSGLLPDILLTPGISVTRFLREQRKDLSLMGQMRVRRTGPWVKISCPFSWVQFNSVRGSQRGSMSITLTVHHKRPLFFHNTRSSSQSQLPKMLQRLFASHAHLHRNVGYEADILFPACH